MRQDIATTLRIVQLVVNILGMMLVIIFWRCYLKKREDLDKRSYDDEKREEFIQKYGDNLRVFTGLHPKLWDYDTITNNISSIIVVPRVPITISDEIKSIIASGVVFMTMPEYNAMVEDPIVQPVVLLYGSFAYRVPEWFSLTLSNYKYQSIAITQYWTEAYLRSMETGEHVEDRISDGSIGEKHLAIGKVYSDDFRSTFRVQQKMLTSATIMKMKDDRWNFNQ